MKKLNKKGFTLTEMIVVIAIIGILAAVLIPSVVIYVQRAQRSNDEQLAASMTDEIERYCILNDVDQSKLLGTDVKSILLFKEYDLTPSRNKWTYVYNSDTGIISVTDLSNISVIDHDFTDPTNYKDKHYLLGNGDSVIEQVISLLCNVQSLSTYQKSVALVGDNTELSKLVAAFDPSHTLYISNTKVFAEYKTDGIYSFDNVVYTEKTVHIPGFIGSNLYKADVTLSFDTTSAILKTIEKDSELSSQFLKLKVMDDSNLLILNDQFKDDLEDLIDNSGNGYLNPSFKLGDNYETALFTTFDFNPVETITKIRVEVENDANVEYKVEYTITRVTISYYNENGLFARATNLYAKEISKTKVETNSTQN